MPTSTAAAKTTTPRKPRQATTVKPAATKATPARAATPAPVEEPSEATPVKVAFELARGEETKSYQKFNLAVDVNGHATGCVGTVYAPLGTESVKVQLAGPAEVIDPE